MTIGLREISTRATDEGGQFDYWREVARWGSAMGMPPFRFEMPAPAAGFQSSLRWCPGEGGVHFLEGRTNVTVGQAAPPHLQGDLIIVGGLRTGSLRIEHDRDQQTILHAGELFVSDYGRRMRMRWAPHNFLFLALPRATVEAALGSRADFAGRTVDKLPGDGLTPMLWMQLCTLADCGRQLDTEEWATALSASADIALTVLRHRFDVRGESPNGWHLGLGLFMAAKRYIERHCHQAGLTSDRIARALGCSRTQLYRVFAVHDMTVADYLRDVRLNRARARLEAGPPHASLAAIADACGYTDLSAFGKAFKQRFGESPSQWRAMTRDRDHNPDRDRGHDYDPVRDRDPAGSAGDDRPKDLGRSD